MLDFVVNNLVILSNVMVALHVRSHRIEEGGALIDLMVSWPVEAGSPTAHRLVVGVVVNVLVGMGPGCFNNKLLIMLVVVSTEKLLLAVTQSCVMIDFVPLSIT